MRLVIQAGLVSIEGKFAEYEKITEVMEKLSDSMYNEVGLVNDTDQEEDLTDISFPYDREEFTIKQVREFYRECKRLLWIIN